MQNKQHMLALMTNQKMHENTVIVAWAVELPTERILFVVGCRAILGPTQLQPHQEQ
jgi:hypothetical protein